MGVTMENTSPTDQEFACEDCGFTSPLTNDVCPNCSGRMTALTGTAPKASDDETDNVGNDTDLSDLSGDDDGGALSLESLQEQESRDDQDEDYGDGDE